MFEITYTMESSNKRKKTFKRILNDEDMANSEKIFQPGRKLTDGSIIKSVSVSKMKK